MILVKYTPEYFVTGQLYLECKTEMDLVEEELQAQNGKVHETYEACSKFANECNLTQMVYSETHKGFYRVGHKGELMTTKEYFDYYGGLLWHKKMVRDKKGEEVTVFEQWEPNPFVSRNMAKVPGEVETNGRKPLYTRDYFRPQGYYNKDTGLFNMGVPFKNFAENTHCNISPIYTLIDNIAGECAPWLLAWLKQKLLYPTQKTQVMPMFTGEEGTGKSAFGDCLCAALFEPENVIVSDKIDLSRNFNAEHTDKLVVSIEEKMEGDKGNTASALKSSVTASQVRKEKKGVDATFQASYTEYILTTNDFVPLGLNTAGDHRRFMIMDTNPHFSRKGRDKELADKVFTWLYGYNADGEKVTDALFNTVTRKVENASAVKQFKWDLLNKPIVDKQGKEVKLREFPHTEAYKRCMTTPRTNENIEVEQLIRCIAPFISDTFLYGRVPYSVDVAISDSEVETLKLEDYVASSAFLYRPAATVNQHARVYINRKTLFTNVDTGKTFSTSVIDRVFNIMARELREDYGIIVGDLNARPPGGFPGTVGVARFSAGVVFYRDPEWKGLPVAIKDAEMFEPTVTTTETPATTKPSGLMDGKAREGCVRFNKFFQKDPYGEFETLNPMEDINGPRELSNIKDWGACFLLEADCPSKEVIKKEVRRLNWRKTGRDISTLVLYRDRLLVQEEEATRLFNEGIAARVVYSGAKSLHIIVQVEDVPSTLEERKWLDAYLKDTLSDRLQFDMSTSDTLRLTRAPVYLPRVTNYSLPPGWVAEGVFKDPEKALSTSIVGYQQVLLENWDNVYKINWRPLYEQWANRKEKEAKEKVRKLMPSKPIYKEAAQAILDGSYFKDNRWNGVRQETFFIAYRLLRAVGWEREELWGEIYAQLEYYYKVYDREYWRTRKDCKLVVQIDEQVNREEEEWKKYM